MGGLWAAGGAQGVHGRRANHPGRSGPQQHRDRLVQTLRNLLPSLLPNSYS